MTINNSTLTFISKHDFHFEQGGTINPLVLVYETYGQLTPQKDNAILIHHALSTNSHVSSHANNQAAGWWEEMVGPGRPIDTNNYFVICINNIGSCFGSSGPTCINPITKIPYRSDFPILTIKDMVRSQHLLLQHLNIPKLFAVVGNSMGAMLSLQWAIEYPDSLQYLISTSSCYRSYPANNANRAIQREIIQLDPQWKQGFYTNNPGAGLKIARKLGHLTYRNPKILNAKFANTHKVNPDSTSEIENYLEYNATKFASYFDTNSYLYLLTAMDLFDATRGYANPHEAFSRIKAKVLVISVDSDILFTPDQQLDLYRELRQANVDVEYIQHHSSYGHDTFLVEIEKIGKYLREFMQMA